MSKKITVLCRFPRGIILTGPSPVIYAYDDANGDHGQKRESTRLELRHGINDDVDADELAAWVTRAELHGLRVEKLTGAVVISDGRPLAADAVARRQQASVLARALNCHATVCPR